MSAEVTKLPPAPPDPNRALLLAIRSTRLLGIVCTLFGLVITIPFGYFNKYHNYRPHFIALGLAVWFIPGVLFFLFSTMLQQKRRRGATGAIVVSFAQLAFALLLLVCTIVLPPISPIPILLCVMWCAALWDQLLRLFQSLPLLEPETARRHGFELSMPLPVEEIEPRRHGDTEAQSSDSVQA